MSLKIGSVCIKTRGRDAGSKCVVISTATKSAKGNVIEVQGLVRKNKRKVNMEHLIPTGTVVKVTKTSKHEDVVKLLK